MGQDAPEGGLPNQDATADAPADTAPPPRAPPVSVTVRSVPAARPDASTAPVAQLETQAELHLLQKSDGTGPPMFCQFDSRYASSPMLVQNNPSEHRTISTSGCGLCALCSYVAAAGCKEMRWDASARAFTAGSAPINPRTFNEYLTHYSELHNLEVSSDGRTHAIYAPDPQGALRDGSSHTAAAIERLVELSHGLDEGSFHGFSCQQNDLHGIAGRPGRDIPELTAWLDSGKPAILGVRFTRGGASPRTDAAHAAHVSGHPGLHQVLAVGYGRIGSGDSASTYYVINDSGWSGCYCPYAATDSRSQVVAFSGRTNPVSAQELLRCSVSPGNSPRGSRRTFIDIFMWKALSGLEQYTNLEMR